MTSTTSELWLVRHGESLGNVTGKQDDTPLTERGREQAQAIMRQLGAVAFNAVLTSPLIRARETAALAYPATTAVVVPALAELVVEPERFVDLSTLSTEALLKMLHSPQEPRETGLEFRQRVRAWLDGLDELCPGKILAFTHAGVIQEILRYITASWDSFPTANAEVVCLAQDTSGWVVNG